MKKRHFIHLTQSHRDRMEALLNAGHAQTEIAHILKVSTSTISRERTRQKMNGIYDADTAQHKADVKRANSKYQGMKVESSPELKQFIIQELTQYRSPDEIAGRMRMIYGKTIIGKDAIYKWVYSAYGHPSCRHLCTRRYRKQRQKQESHRSHIPHIIPLSMRPREGIHAQGDTFVSSKRSETTRSGIMVVIPPPYLLVGCMIPNRKETTMVPAMQQLTTSVSIDDLTLDRGIENTAHERYGVPTYFCEAHHPWEKPDVENSIGLLRRWFIPKKTDLGKISNENLQTYLSILNHKWRKSLGYKSAYEVALEYGIIAEIPDKKITTEKVAFEGRI